MVTEGSVVPGTGRGRVHVRSPGFRFGADKLSPAADDPGRTRVLGIGVRNGAQGLDAALRGVLVVPSKGFGGESVQGRDCPGGRHLQEILKPQRREKILEMRQG